MAATAGFMLLTALSKSQNREMLFLFLVFGAIPAAFAAALVFVPIELAAKSLGLARWATPAVVLAGALLVFLFDLLVAFKNGSQEFRSALVRWVGPERAASVRLASWWIVLGAIWGALWRMSAAVVAWAGVTA